MERERLRAVQAPLKERYGEEAAAALVTLSASGVLGEGISCSVQTGRALAEAGLLERRPIEIVASDGSAAMVARAREGVYGERSLRALPPELRARWFRPEGVRWRVDPLLHGRIRWTTANLVDPAAVAPLADTDVIFCRNVFIYFSDQSISRTVRTFAAHIRPPGHLFVAASESPNATPLSAATQAMIAW